MKIYNLLILILLLVSNWAFGQDVHFSNPKFVASYFNPAQTGVQSQKWQIGLQHRMQWIGIGSGFQTSALSAERRVNRMGFGGQVFQKKAGIGNLKSMSGRGAFSYTQPLTGKSFLRVGTAIGFRQNSIDPVAMTFDQQFVEGVGFDSNLNNNEQFLSNQKTLVEGAAGLVFQTKFRKIDLTIGGAIHNPHQPNEGFQTSTALPMKMVYTGNLKVPINQKNTIVFNGFYQQQEVQNERLIGFDFFRKINKQTTIGLGLRNRLQDAWVASANIEWNNTKLILSYDYNTSSLRQTTHGNGAIELGLQMSFGKQRIRQAKKIIPRTIPENRVEEEINIKDTDKDGLIDDADQCPNLPGSIQNNGCPDQSKDSDKDGVPDELDQCVYLKGSIETGGCPDSDGDGLLDNLDKCPHLKGTKAANGCPE